MDRIIDIDGSRGGGEEEKVESWDGMRIVGGDGDREEGERGREGYMKRREGGKGRAVIRMGFS